MRKRVAVLTSLALLTPLTQLPLPVAGAAEDLASRFTLQVMPDTQFYARYGTEAAGDIFGSRYGSNPFDSQTEFIAKNHEKLGTQFVTQLGDLVDQADDRASWDIASDAMKVLEDAHVDYSTLPGNHDYDMYGATSAFQTYFPDSRAAKIPTFKGRFESTDIYNSGQNDYGFPGQTVESEYHIFEAEGQQYLVLALGFRANDDTLDWAQKVIDEHPNLPVILTTHEIDAIDGDGTVHYSEEYGEHLWDYLIRKNDQIFLTLAAHNHGAGYHTETNDAGHQVISILQDYQMAYLGGNGLMGQLQFDLTNNQLEMTAYSPWVKEKKTEQLTSFDHLLPEGKGDSYVINFNFADRFKSFDKDWTKGDENDPNYAEILKQTLKDGYTPYTITGTDKPKDSEDYAHVDGTVVHWRPGQTKYKGQKLADGASAPAGSIIPDIAADNDMRRVAYRRGSNAEQVTFSKDKHPLSADGGSLRFEEPTAKEAVSWFETESGAAINNMHFDNGYTIEAFLKLDKDWNGDDNGWSNALVRDADGTDMNPEDPDGDPIQMLGVSNLRELRWYSLGNNGDGFSNWSHEVPKGEWMHVAVVNDPKDKSVTMYVDGSPILRDGYGPLGMAGEGYKWILGTSEWENQKVDGWYGNIGEIRIVDHAIGQDQWLTARNTAPADTEPGAGQGSSDGSSHGSSIGSSSGSSKHGNVGAFLAGTAFGALGVLGAVIALIASLGGALGDYAEQIKGMLHL